MAATVDANNRRLLRKQRTMRKDFDEPFLQAEEAGLGPGNVPPKFRG